MIIKRYEIYLASLDPTIGEEIRKPRPVVIVSDDMMNKIDKLSSSDSALLRHLITQMYGE